MKLGTLSLLFINMVLVWGGATTVSVARALRPVLFLERLRNVRRIATNIVQVRGREPRRARASVMERWVLVLASLLGAAQNSERRSITNRTHVAVWGPWFCGLRRN
jgi:hypothetical protein